MVYHNLQQLPCPGIKEIYKIKFPIKKLVRFDDLFLILWEWIRQKHNINN